MGNVCTQEVQILGDNDVMDSQNSAIFQRAQDIFTSCIDSGANFFSVFCLYPPVEGNMKFMCSGPNSFNPSFLFSQMVENELTNVSQLPVIISYKRLTINTDWV